MTRKVRLVVGPGLAIAGALGVAGGSLAGGEKAPVVAQPPPRLGTPVALNGHYRPSGRSAAAAILPPASTQQGQSGVPVPSPTSGPVVSPTAAQLHTAAVATSGQFGETAPTDMVTVKTTFAAAVGTLANGDGVSGAGQQPVHVISMRGRFVVYSRPPGAPTPSGGYLTITVDDATGRVLGVTIARSAPALTALGTVESVATPPSG